MNQPRKHETVTTERTEHTEIDLFSVISVGLGG
jgi:hypothetical protein